MTRTHICPLSLHDALPIFNSSLRHGSFAAFWLHNNKGRLTRGCNPTSSKFIHTWLRFGEIMRGSLSTQFIQLDIEPQEIDSNRPIAVPVVGDIASSMQGMLAELKQNTFTTPLVWRDILNIHKQQNAQKMHEKLSTDTQPLNYFNALSAVRDVLRENQDIYLVN